MEFECLYRPIIKGKVGDKEAYFLLDTGSSLGLIDSTQADEYNLIKGRKFPGTIIGTGGVTKNTYYCDSEINIGEKILKNFILIDIESIRNSILRDTEIKILGVISYPLMKDMEITINPAKNEINGI